MLSKCLRSLALARTQSKPEVHIYADAVSESRLREIEVVRDLYFPEAFLFRAKPHVEVPSGSWNILNSLKHAARYADSVYLVEEDVVVYPNFFEWHESQDDDVSCGRIDLYTFRRRNQYTNPGSFLRRAALNALIPHINDDYYADQQGYCEKNLGADHGFLDDGLIRRVIDKNQLRVKLADPAVCSHIGFRMYNHAAPYMNEGTTIQEKIVELDRILALVNALPLGHLYRYLYEASV
jgi:hypothetical protein